MDIGELAYLIFFVIIAIANWIRSQARKRQMDSEGSQRGPETYEQETAEEEPGLKEIWEEMFGEVETEPAETRTSTPETVVVEPPRRSRTEEKKKAPVRERKSRRQVDYMSNYSEPVYEEGMSFEDFVAKQRESKRHTVSLLEDSSKQEEVEHEAVEFDLRQAVIAEAILKRPYQ